ncbi:dipeptidyl peptidase 1-like protein, partial [Leptotrombidium deliense]
TLLLIKCDTPANCTYDDIRGLWTFYETQRSFDRTVDCDTAGPTSKETKIQLSFPNIATDEYGNKGVWTIIYNQGFEVHINYRKYFAFSDYATNGSKVTSYCHRTMPGWSHDILGNNWSCFVGRKQKSMKPKVHVQAESELLNQGHLSFRNDVNLIRKINTQQSSWKAGVYKHF